jgi:hypothetical protein
MKSSLLLIVALCCMPPGLRAAGSDSLVKLVRAPDGGLQPQAILDAAGVLHLVYLKGDPKACDVFYVQRPTGTTNFSAPIRVNSEPNSAIAIGTIRGVQLALGRNGRPHVAWNGCGAPKAERGAPMLYARLNDARTAFDPQRNVMTSTMNLDGGGSIAADDAGNVFVIWHAASVEGPKGEQNRGVFMAQSVDEGKTFAAERKINPTATGACGCCGLKAFADKHGRLAVLYRAAGGGLDRDATLLLSMDRGKTFSSAVVGPLRLGTCPMSSMDITAGPDDSLLAMWEKDGQVYDTRIAPPSLDFPAPESPGGTRNGRKHPAIAYASTGKGSRRLTAWTEGTGWQKGGSLAWEVVDSGDGRKITGRAPGVPVWSRITAVAETDGTFTIVY